MRALFMAICDRSSTKARSTVVSDSGARCRAETRDASGRSIFSVPSGPPSFLASSVLPLGVVRAHQGVRWASGLLRRVVHVHEQFA